MYEINNEDIVSCDLLSAEEAENIPRWILRNGSFWWLRSKGDKRGRTIIVDNVGYFYPYAFVDGTGGGVRPALRISNLSSLEVGETVKVFGLLAQYIGNDSVLLCESIFNSRFDEQSNAYETSEVKQKINDWFNEMRGLNK